MKNKKAFNYAQDVEKTRRLLKQFLYALHKSEGFGERRLMRVLLEWTEVYKEVNEDSNNNMILIDKILDRVCPSRMITKSIGEEKIELRKQK